MKYKGAVAQISQPFHYRTLGNMTRLWVHSQWCTPKGSRFGEITLSPNHKAFPHPVNGLPRGDMDEALRRLKDQGVSPIVCVANAYHEQFPEVHFKGLPKDNPTLDKTNINSYSIYRKIIKQIALRWGSVQNDSLIDISDTGYTGVPQIKKSGMNLINFMQFFNEVNKYNGKNADAESLTGAEYADLFDTFITDVWTIDPDIKVIASPTARFDQTWLESFYNRMIGFGFEDDPRIYYSVNQYLFGGCSFGQTCNAVKPEDSPLFEQINTWMKERNLFYFITEHGCNSEKKYDLSYPDYLGRDKFECQAKFIIDSTNRWLSMSNCVGATFYQLIDDPNEPRFSETGVCDKDSTTNPTPKKSFEIVKEAFAQETPVPPQPPASKPLSAKFYNLEGVERI